MLKRFIALKFLYLFIPGFLLFTGLFRYCAVQRHTSGASDQLAARIGTQLARVSGLISSQILTENPELASKFLSTMMSDPAIICVEASMSGKVMPKIAQPRRLGCNVLKPEKTTEIAISGANNVKLFVGYSEAEIAILESESFVLALYTVFAGLLAAVIFGVIAFQRSVGKPISGLLSAMNAPRGNELHLAPVSSADEIGNLCTAFNAMQTKIRDEELQTKDALDNLNNVYNSTPALLFTMNKQGFIQSVSEFWMVASGYKSEEVIGHSLESLICPESRTRLKSSVLDDLKTVGSVRDVPIRLWYKDGSEVDVLLSVVPDQRRSEQRDSFVCIMNDVTLLRRTEKSLRSIAITDQLTQLSNRHAVNEYFEKNMMRANSDAKNWAMLFLDLDNFKTVNDSFGHEAGDEILRSTATRIKEIVGQSGMIARIGGDEFVVILPELSNVEKAKAMAEKLIESITQPVKLSEGFGAVGVSIGIAYCEDNAIEPTEALRLSDQAMYLAKSTGKNRYVLYEKNQAAPVRDRADQVQIIQNGVDNDWFEIYFQPIVNIETLKPYAFEALLRVKKEGAPVNSIEGLIRIAEETDQIGGLGEWILDESISKFNEFCSDNEYKDISISINLSPLQLTENFVRRVKLHLQNQPEMSSRIIFEITETAALGRFDAVCHLLQDLRNHGIRIAIDDFGTGYSSLSYISRLPVDILKLDKSFIEARPLSGQYQPKPGAHRALLRSISNLALDLGLDIVAEGLESNSLVAQYQSLGVKFGQGFVFAKPMPSSDAKEWLATFSSENSMDNLQNSQKLLA